MIGKILISSQMQAISKNTHKNSRADLQEMDSSSSNFEDDCLEQDKHFLDQ